MHYNVIGMGSYFTINKTKLKRIMNRPKKTVKDYDSFGNEICDFDDYILLEQYCDYLERKVKLLTIPNVSNALFCVNCNHLAQHTELNNGDFKCKICGYIAKL